jgi:hypothetical protein
MKKDGAVVKIKADGDDIKIIKESFYYGLN